MEEGKFPAPLGKFPQWIEERYAMERVIFPHQYQIETQMEPQMETDRWKLRWQQAARAMVTRPAKRARRPLRRPARSIEEIMEFYLCSREVAEEMVREGIV